MSKIQKINDDWTLNIVNEEYYDWTVDIASAEYIESSLIQELREIDHYLVIIHNLVKNRNFEGALNIVKKIEKILIKIN